MLSPAERSFSTKKCNGQKFFNSKSIESKTQPSPWYLKKLVAVKLVGSKNWVGPIMDYIFINNFLLFSFILSQSFNRKEQ